MIFDTNTKRVVKPAIRVVCPRQEGIHITFIQNSCQLQIVTAETWKIAP